MSISVDGTNEVQSSRIVCARKEHKCCACHETIRVGDKYEYFFLVYEGDPDYFKRCLRCKAIYDELVSRLNTRGADWEEWVDFSLNCGHSWEEVQDEPCPDHIARLAFLTPDEIQRELAPAAKGAP